MLPDLVEVLLSQGRWHLKVGGVYVATETDLCRDPEIADKRWTRSSLNEAAAKIRESIRIIKLFDDIGG